MCLEKTFFKEKRKRKGLAQAIAQTTNRTTTLGETVHETILEKANEETGVLEHGEITSSVPITTVHTLAIQSIPTVQQIRIRILPEAEAEVEVENLFTETLVRIIQMTWLLPHLIYLKTR